MDPLSISASAAALLTICVQAVQILKSTIETLSSAKKFLLKLLTQTERVRLFLEQLRSLTKQLGRRSEILLAYNDSGPRETINELNDFVRHMAQSGSWVRLKVLVHQNTADRLVKALHRHEEEIIQVLLSIATASSIRTEEEIQQMYEIVVLHARVASPFDSCASTLLEAPGALMGNPELPDPQQNAKVDLSSQPSNFKSSDSFGVQIEHKEDIDPASTVLHEPNIIDSTIGDSKDIKSGHASNPIRKIPAPVPSGIFSEAETRKEIPKPRQNSPQTADKLQIWFGDLSRSGFDTQYLSLRDKLAECAFWGDFDEMSKVLTDIENTFGQSWVNAPRLRSTPERASGWTPLHQAVLTGASVEEISRLIEDHGALRLLRTAWTDPAEFPYRDMTAAEIAHERGYTHLYEILAPYIYHSIPHDALAKLQTHFHKLICEDLVRQKEKQNIAHFRLPDLAVLTELKEPLMWFPLKSEKPKSLRGYMYRLDGRDLLIKSFGVSDDDDDDDDDDDNHGNTKLYRISSSGILGIEEAIMFSDS